MGDFNGRAVRVELKSATLAGRLRLLDLSLGFKAGTLLEVDGLGRPVRSQLLAIDAIDMPALIAALRFLKAG